MGRFARLTLSLLSAALLAGCANNPGPAAPPVDKMTLSRQEFEAVMVDKHWPLTVDAVRQVCGVANTKSVGIEVDGKRYALNGTAKTFEGWPLVSAPIWAENPDVPGSKLNIGPLIEYVQMTCGSR